MSPSTTLALHALQVHADDEGFADAPAALRRCGLSILGFQAALVDLVKRDIVDAELVS